jgi:hypothetical protein
VHEPEVHIGLARDIAQRDTRGTSLGDEALGRFEQRRDYLLAALGTS